MAIPLHGSPALRCSTVRPPTGSGSSRIRRARASANSCFAGCVRDSPRTHYLQCSYDRSNAVLTMPLPPGVRACELVFERGNTIPGGSMPVKRMFCR